MLKNNNKEKISVIIPTYNRSFLLKRAVRSVLDQNYSNLELIIVDDASSDNTKDNIKKLRDQRIFYIKNSRNKGPNFSRNLGLRKSRGDYIAFLDDDDYYSDKNKLKKQVELFNKNKKLVFVGCQYFDKLTQTKRSPHLKGKISKNLLLNFSDIETSTILIKTSAIEKVGFFDESLPSEQNHDFFYRISKVGEFDYLDEVMVIKDQPETQISSNPKNKIFGYILFHKKHFRDIKYLNLKKKVYLFFKFCIVTFFYSTSIISKKNIKIVRFINLFMRNKE